MTDSSNSQGEETIKSTLQRYNIIAKDVESHSFKDGEIGHLLSNKWYSRFKRASKQNNDEFNLPIDNNHLFDTNNEIKQWIIKNRDYIVVSDKSWNLLSKWFEIVGPSKDVLSVKDPVKQKIISDVIPSSFMIYYHSPNEEGKNLSKQVFISKYAKVSDLKLKALKDCGLYKEGEASTESRLRDYLNQNGRQVLDDEKTLLDYDFTFEPDLFLEKKDDQGNWPEIKKTGYIPSRKNSQSKHGIVGIVNFGNQCFQIAIIQALGHCRPFINIITDEKYNNITKSSNISILRQFRLLIKQMWNNETGNSLDLTRLFKAISDKEGKTKNFTDRRQHDAHEYLIGLLDDLIGQTSPDQNVSETKICVLEPSDGTTINDQKTAEKNWNMLIEANKSPIYPLFYFLESERHECLKCHNVSSIFNQTWFIEIPFTTLSKKQQSIIWVPFSSENNPLKFIIKIDNENITDEDCKNKINETLKENNISFENNTNSTIAFAYQRNLDQSAIKKAKLISSSSSSEVLNFRPEFIFTEPKKVTNNLYAFEIPDKTKSYFLANFSIPNFDLTLVNAFICQFEEEESEEEAKRITIAHLKKSLFGKLFKVEDPTSDIDSKIFKEIKITGSLVQNDRYKFLYNLVVNVTIDLDYQMNTQPRRSREITVFPNFDITDLLKERSLSSVLDQPALCSHCNEKQNMSVSSHFCNMPEILVIHVAPYKLQVDHFERIKVKITFPETLLMKDCMIESKKNEETKYKLFSVVVHAGPDPNFGHYYTYAFHDKRKEWFVFNDEVWSNCELSMVLQADPFLLFYQKVTE